MVALTGVLRAIPEVGSLHGLFHTSFGLTLLVKTGLFLVLLGLGARNHFQLVPRARRQRHQRTIAPLLPLGDRRGASRR